MKDRCCDQCGEKTRSRLSVPPDWSVMCINTHAIAGQHLSSALLCPKCSRRLRQMFKTFNHAKVAPAPHPRDLSVAPDGSVS